MRAPPRYDNYAVLMDDVENNINLHSEGRAGVSLIIGVIVFLMSKYKRDNNNNGGVRGGWTVLLLLLVVVVVAVAVAVAVVVAVNG